VRSISATEAKQNLAALLDIAQREPVVIRRHEREVAVVVSTGEYERLRAMKISEFQRFCDQVAEKVAARGMTPEIVEQLLSDDDSAASGH
jgi:prevent-host-death family protein